MSVRELSLSCIDDGASQNMRSKLENVEELAVSIKDRGLIHPVLVKETDDPHKFKLIAGFRRIAAHKFLGAETIKANVKPKDLPRQEELLLQLAENVDRHDVRIFDVARQIKKLVDECSLTRENAAKQLNKSQAWVSNYLGVFDLPETVQEQIKIYNYGVGQVRFLHAMLKKVEETQLPQLAKKILGKDQKYLDSLGERLAKVVRRTQRKASQEELEASEETQLVTRSIEQVQSAIGDTNQRISAAKAGTPEYLKLLGRLETLQWLLGDDSVVF